MNRTNIEWMDHRKGDSQIHSHNGYMLVYCPNHPYAKSKGHVYEHRYVLETHLKRYLNRDEIVHHLNGNASDNRIENLSLMLNGPHVKHHHSVASPEILKQRKENARKIGYKNRIGRMIILCSCGCGEKLEDRNKYGRKRKFIKGHNQKGKSWKWEKHV